MMNNTVAWCLWLVVLAVVCTSLVRSQGFFHGRQVDDVGIICSEDGITGRLSFERPFSGKIYSRHYAHVKECVFYDSHDQHVILFAMPNYRCGTVVRRNSRNLISHLENEVYVQFDKMTQTAIDRRYLFVCDESPPKNLSSHRLSFTSPEQTVIIQTMQATKFPVDTRDKHELKSDVQMEILEGSGTGKPKVSRSLKIGDPITLVVKGPKSGTDSFPPNYDMTVHSCYAHDGSGANRIDLTDKHGCALRDSITEVMRKSKSGSDQLVFYLPMTAFRFPQSDDVYFSCSVEICESCRFPEPCGIRTRRSANVGSRDGDLEGPDWFDAIGRHRLQSVVLHDSLKITEDDGRFDGTFAELRVDSAYCVHRNVFMTLSCAFCLCFSLLLFMTGRYVFRICSSKASSSRSVSSLG